MPIRDHEGRGRGARRIGPEIPAVTVLTSYDDGDLHPAGYRLSVSDLVEARAQQAQVLGVDGLVSSPEGGVLAQDRRASMSLGRRASGRQVPPPVTRSAS
jgi:orotidine-5'-phosphate decarboxylase